MELSQELIRAKNTLSDSREMAYQEALKGDNTFEVSEGKTVTMVGGTERLWSLQTAYDSLFVDLETPELDGKIKQSDGSLVDCTRAEWDSLFEQMRAKGKEYFVKNETLIYRISILTEENTMSEVWTTTWENQA